jgi:ABC-type glycerol-3-phosphate transport system substrate-binding protein
MLEPVALARVAEGALAFCAHSACTVVYFGAAQSFDTSAVRVPVWQKEPAGDRMLCYCFGENEADIQRECEAMGASSAVARVQAQIAAGRCACEVRNPRGVCCLGDVSAAVRRAQDSLLKPVSS